MLAIATESIVKLLAFLLVGIVVFVFLGDWRSTLIPAIAVPVSLVGTFAFMQVFDISLNMITLFALVLAIGIVVGLISAYKGGWTDAVIMRIVDLQLSFPAILIALILLAVTGQGVDKIVIALITVQWAYYARTVRGAALVEKRKEYVDAALCLGYSAVRIVLRHIMPNVLPPLIVVATVQVAHAIALEATLSFLGLGMPITSPSLGLLISNGFTHLLSGKYWISFFPGMALLVMIVSINLVADRLRDVLNPKLQKQ